MTDDSEIPAQAYLDAGWEVQQVSLYDEEGVEGWRWDSPEGDEYVVMGAWDTDPPTDELPPR